MTELSPILFPILFLTGAVAGLIDSIAGGGGLITIPVLLGCGLPPADALGTNKLQASFGSGSAMLHFVRAGVIHLRQCGEGIVCTAIGAALGVWAVQRTDPNLLRHLIPWLLVLIAAYTLFTPRLGFDDRPPRFPSGPFYLLVGLTIG